MDQAAGESRAVLEQAIGEQGRSLLAHDWLTNDGEATAPNNKVTACARFARSGEHGAGRRAGNLETLEDIGGGVWKRSVGTTRKGIHREGCFEERCFEF